MKNKKRHSFIFGIGIESHIVYAKDPRVVVPDYLHHIM